jgi:hypothetical protein
MLQGILPDTPAVDPDVALKTADKIWEVWGDSSIFGWGRPVLAINSARIGNRERAIHHLTAYDYWIFDDAGRLWYRIYPRTRSLTVGNQDLRPVEVMVGHHHRSFLEMLLSFTQVRTRPPPYCFSSLILWVVAYVTAGWQGSEGNAPGFPDDGSWVVKHEGMVKAL